MSGQTDVLYGRYCFQGESMTRTECSSRGGRRTW